MAQTLTAEAIGRSIREAARFFDAAETEMDDAAMATGKGMVVNPDFAPSPVLREAVVAYARALDAVITPTVTEERYGGPGDFEIQDAGRWKKAVQEEPEKEYWDRIVAVMVKTAERNKVSVIPGDPLFVPLRRVVREELEFDPQWQPSHWQPEP